MKAILKSLIIALAAVSHGASAGSAYSIEDAIYRIEIVDGNKIHYGTGVLISRNTILTNCHVVKHDGLFRVINRKTGNVFPTQSYTTMGGLDACLLKGSVFEGNPVPMQTEYRNGDPVWAYGYPVGHSAMSQGVMVGLLTTDVGVVMQTTSFCHPGSSGGPLVNARGELIGLVFGTKTTYKDHCLAIPVLDILSKMPS